MDLGSIFLVLALFTLVGLFISRPFFERKEVVSGAETTLLDHQRSALLAERDRILNALQELDFDYALGKIPEEDYPEQRSFLLQGGADVLRQLDALQEEVASDDVEARLEAAIAARRADAKRSVAQADGEAEQELKPAPPGRVPQAPALDDELEAILANRRRARQEKAAGFCPQCGRATQKSDRFCPKCGASLE